MIVAFVFLTDYNLQTVVIRRCRNFTDFFDNYEITKTKTPKFTVKFDLKLGGKDRTRYNLTGQTYFGYNLTLYFDGFDFRGLSFRNLEN